MKCCIFLLAISCQLSAISYIQAQQRKTINLVHANSEEFDKKLGNGAQRLIGNVQLADDTTTLFCDSAYFYSDNSFHAFGHVHMTRKDTMDLYGDSLYYSGATRQAQMFGKIRCIRKAMTLTTRHLLFDIGRHFLNYWDGGTIVDSSNVLTSLIGIYNTQERMCYFKEKVVLTNPKYVIHCDTMLYSPESRTAIFRGPTRITSKSNFMYCEKGYYNTQANYCQFSKNPYIINKKGDRLSGDQIFYDRENDVGQVLDNVSLQDTADNITIKGDYAQYRGSDKTLLVTCKALLLQVYDKDTLHLHGDTLFGLNISVSDTETSSAHSTEKSSAKGQPKTLLAYHHVKFYKKDLQGKCDSLAYIEKDSVMKMFYSPILWSDVNQLTADTMKLYMKNKKLNMLDMINNSFIISKDTLASRLMEDEEDTGKMKNEELRMKNNGKLNKSDSLGKDGDTTKMNNEELKIMNNEKAPKSDSLGKDSSSNILHSSFFILHSSDTLQFNQIKGRNMKAYFRDNKIYKVNVKGNAQTIYYVYSDNNTVLMGVNRTESSSMLIFIVNNKINSITFLQKPDATLFPMKQVKPLEFLLGGFHWLESQKPRSIADIFGENP